MDSDAIGIVIVTLLMIVWLISLVVRSYIKLKKSKEKIEGKLAYLTHHIDEVYRECDIKCEATTKRLQDVTDKYYNLLSVFNDQSQEYHFLSDRYTCLISMTDEAISRDMCMKARPAYSTANKLRDVSREKSKWAKRALRAEQQLKFYENIFPWLEDFKELPAEEAYDAVNGAVEKSEYDHYKNYLSPEEYHKLTSAQRNQLALDRYKSRKKSNWEIGIDFERYIGYKYEQQGFTVDYNGALQGLEDMGRDLIVTKGRKAYVIQCKRWAKEKQIREKHIFQLYGTTVLYKVDHPQYDVEALFVTTTELSDVAEKVASYLDVKIITNYPVGDYPMVKCNINNGERIYHLPFDQQYDNVRIIPEKGERFVFTVAEAERLGFRHAYKWHGN